MDQPSRGHRARPHTADVRVEAWGPTLAACLEEACAGFVGVWADVPRAATGRHRRLRLAPAAPDRLLVALLEQVLVLLDAEGLVPRSAQVELAADGSLVADLDVVAVADVEPVGPAAKGVSYDGLRVGLAAGTWRAEATVDV